MKRLLGLLLVMGMVGCGDSVAKLEKLGASIERNDNGEVVEVHLAGDQVTDTGHVLLNGHQVTDATLVYLKGLTKLTALSLSATQVTDAGMVHLLGLTNLQTLNLSRTQVTDAGVAELRQALPNCEINH